MTVAKKSKSGVYTEYEKNFITKHALDMKPEEIAEALDRPITGIEKFIREDLTLGGDKAEYRDKLGILDELHKSDIWFDAEEMFSPDELKKFESVWIQMCHQFQNDLEYTEKLQIRDLCRTEIMMSRNLIEQRTFAKQVEDLSKERQAIVDSEDFKNHDPEAKQNLFQYDAMINNSKTACSNREVQYIKLHENKQKIYDKINANRSDRIKNVLGGKVSLLQLLKSFDQEEIRDAEGRELELMKMATKKEYDRLTEFHEFADGIVDRPFLFPEVVTDEDARNV